MLLTKNQGSRHCGFRQEDFFMFFQYKPMLTNVTPRVDHFWHKGYNLNKNGKGLQDNVTHQMPRL